MSKIKPAYHDEICKLRETDDPYDWDWQEKEWEQSMYRHKESLKWLEGIMRKNAEYQREDEK